MNNKQMKANTEKLQQFFKYNYYQWATPRTELDAKRYALVKAWRKQTQPITKHEEEDHDTN